MMNSLWPAAPRLSCLNPLLKPRHRINTLAARLAQRQTRSHSISLRPQRNIDAPNLRGCISKTIWRYPGNLTCTSPTGVRTFASRRIITQYSQVPADYRDNQGLPFRETDLSQAEVGAIFGQETIDVGAANKLLQVIHGRRVAGTLDDPAFGTTGRLKKAESHALQWLRENIPVDEVQSAGLKAEEELAKMEGGLISEAERLGLYVPNSGNSENVYGEGMIEKIRKKNEAKFDQEQADIQKAEEDQLSQADENRDSTGTLTRISAKSQVEMRRPGENPKLKYYLERSEVLPDRPPEMTILARLGPSAILVVAVLVGCWVFTLVYKFPKKEARTWPSIPPSAATIITLISMNTAVMVLWRHPPAFRMLNKYFIVVPGYPRVLSLVGSVFSHQGFKHFAVNMAILWYAGTSLHDSIGRANFLAIYLAAGVFGNYVSLAAWVLRGNFISSTLGASGAISGIIAAALWLKGGEKVTVFGFPPDNWPSISSMAFLVLLMGADVYGVSRWSKGIKLGIDHWAHLGGYSAGIAGAEIMKTRRRQRRNIEMERRRNLGLIDKIKEGRL